MISEKLFHAEIAKDTYLISTSAFGPTEDGRSLEPGSATANSYLIVGGEKALLFDLAVDEEGVYEYAKNLAQKEVMTVMSHGHYDHVYHLNERDEAWIHKEDEYLLREGMPIIGAPPVNPCPKLHELEDGDTIRLGNRNLKVIHIPGHTPGSILLLDENTGILFSGDTGARRLLFGVSGEVDLDDFCKSLERLRQEKFQVMYSAHDRCALPKAHIDLMLGVIRKEVEAEWVEQTMPGVGTFMTVKYGRENEVTYFDMSRLVD
jgi:glyoxylase-like metal-dependent hydrolase (beta-lactamase superfamily II)